MEEAIDGNTMISRWQLLEILLLSRIPACNEKRNRQLNVARIDERIVVALDQKFQRRQVVLGQSSSARYDIVITNQLVRQLQRLKKALLE
jgi:hypothetical protein